jgi:hypothetical protein
MNLWRLAESRKIPGRTASCLMFVAALAVSLPAHAEVGRIGWVWANEPTTASYTPDAAHSYNSRSGANTITRVATGDYEIHMAGLYRGTEASNVQVTAYGADGNYCIAGVWGQAGGSNVGIAVQCFNASGAVADSQFTVMYQSHSGNTGTATKGLAFVTTNPDTFPPPYSYNSAGGTNTVTHNGTGSYTVALPGLSTSGGDVQVTAVGSLAQRCKVDNWSADVGTTDVNVQCYDGTGASADEYFSLAYLLSVPYAVTTPPTNYQAYVWADKSTDRNEYTPDDQRNFSNMKAGPLKVLKTGTGTYTVTIPGTVPTYSTSNVLVTSYGSDNSYCNIVSWATSTINVACYAAGGTPANEQFDVSFQAWE